MLSGRIYYAVSLAEHRWSESKESLVRGEITGRGAARHTEYFQKLKLLE